MTAVRASATYRELLVEIEPRPIRSEDQADHYRELIYEMTDMPELTDDQRDFVGLLAELVDEWETREDDDLQRSTPVDIVRSLLEENGLRQQALVGPVFPNRHMVSDFLAGRCPLTVKRAVALGEFFNVSPGLFIPTTQGPR